MTSQELSPDPQYELPLGLPYIPTDDEIRHDVSRDIAYGEMRNPHMPPEEKEPPQSWLDQGHAGGQTERGVPLEKIAAEEARKAEKAQYYQDEFGLSGVAEPSKERDTGLELCYAVIEARKVRKRVPEYADEARKKLAQRHKKQ